MTRFRDPQLERELQLGGLDPAVSPEEFGDLTAYLGKSLEQIAEDYWHYRATEDVDAQARVAGATDEGPVMAYYQSTPHYLYELSYWEASHDKQAWLRVLSLACRKFGLRRVADYGGGVGGVTIHLRGRGVPCEYIDVKGKTFDYAAWRFARRGWQVPMFNVMAAWPTGPYDAITTWDVLEHVFDLEEAIKRLGRILRPGGLLLSKSTFATADGQHLHIHLAKHLQYADVRVFNEMVAGVGFRFLGQLKPSRLSRFLRVCGMPYAVAGVRVTPRLKHGGNFLLHARAAGA